MRKVLLYDAVYKLLEDKLKELLRYQLRDDSKILEFCVYCRERLKNNYLISLIGREYIDAYIELSEELCKSSNIPLRVNLRGVIGNLVLVVPDIDKEYQLYLEGLKSSVDKKSEYTYRRIVYALYLRHYLASIVKFVNELSENISLKEELEDHVIQVYGSRNKQLYAEKVSLSNRYNSPKQKNQILSIMKLEQYHGIFSKYGYVIDVDITTKKYDTLSLLGDKNAAKTVALSIALI